MHCPKCGQQQMTDDTRFCSRCGFLLTGIAVVVSNAGLLPDAPLPPKSWLSLRRRGIKQGLFFFLLSFLIVPLIAIATVAVNAEPFAVVISAIIFVVGGLLRMAYALLFESDRAPDLAGADTPKVLQYPAASAANLPPGRTIPAADYASPMGSWRDTNELSREPGSVTDSTTKLLEKDEKFQ